MAILHDDAVFCLTKYILWIHISWSCLVWYFTITHVDALTLYSIDTYFDTSTTDSF